MLLPGHHGWYNFYTDRHLHGNGELIDEVPLDKLPVFVKAGSIIPMQETVYSTDDRTQTCLQLHIYYGNQKTDFVYYEDDGDTFDHEAGVFYKRTFTNLPHENKFLFGEVEGSYVSRFTTVKLLFHGFPGLLAVHAAGHRYAVHTDNAFSFMKPLPKFDPLGKTGASYHLHLQNAELPLSGHFTELHLERY